MLKEITRSARLVSATATQINGILAECIIAATYALVLFHDGYG